MVPFSIIQSLYKELNLWKNIDETVKEIGISFGTVIWKPSDSKTIINLIEEADQRMYQQKKNKNYSRHN
ncbi:diguanylate cyclase domain-containing protein [Pelotomaculum isophthalicicum]|uniref:diguanylate cyclase domain-containing protein n=1 Tax=Pelotomaculum isophthalicicum TaxID=342448 RepID=UPI003B84B5AA